MADKKISKIFEILCKSNKMESAKQAIIAKNVFRIDKGSCTVVNLIQGRRKFTKT